MNGVRVLFNADLLARIIAYLRTAEIARAREVTRYWRDVISTASSRELPYGRAALFWGGLSYSAFVEVAIRPMLPTGLQLYVAYDVWSVSFALEVGRVLVVPEEDRTTSTIHEEGFMMVDEMNTIVAVMESQSIRSDFVKDYVLVAFMEGLIHAADFTTGDRMSTYNILAFLAYKRGLAILREGLMTLRDVAALPDYNYATAIVNNPYPHQALRFGWASPEEFADVRTWRCVPSQMAIRCRDGAKKRKLE